MNFLDRLTPDHRQTIVRLPYRVGLLVSRSDKAGGAAADERELQALSSILHGFADEMFGSEIIQYIMSDTIRQQSDWKNWGDNLEFVPDDCKVAIDQLRQYAEPKDAKAFKNHLLEIAEAVALAFREEERVSAFSLFGMYIKYMLAVKKKGRRARTFAEYQNISANEQKALDTIADALEAA